MKFYTYPPTQRLYPYVLRNIDQKPLECGHEIVDIKIFDFVKSGEKYPKNKIKDWKKVEPNGWKVVPDYPDLSGEFGKDIDFCNVEYSKELLNDYYEPDNETHLPVIQSKFLDINSFKEYGKWFISVYGEPEKIAMAGLSKATNHTHVGSMLKIARFLFKDSHIHVFGLEKTAAIKYNRLFDSWDTMSWTHYPGIKKTSGNVSERRVLFDNYLYSLKDVIGVYYGA